MCVALAARAFCMSRARCPCLNQTAKFSYHLSCKYERRPCPCMPPEHGGMTAGIVLAAVAGIAVALLIWGCIWFCVLRKRQRPTAADEKGHLPGKPMGTNASSNLSTAAMLAHLGDVHTGHSAKSGAFDSWKQSTPVINADTIASPEGTMFVTSRNITNVSETSQWPLPEARVIPAPLWQDVEISPDNICVVQTAAGTDWVLGQGSYGTVSSSQPLDSTL